MNIDFNLYEGKSYNDLLKDIVTNTENKRDQIDIVISELRDQIKTINDAIVLAPIIQSYLDTSVKNDEQLVKLAAVLQRLLSAQSEGTEGTSFGLSDAEKEQLLKDIKDIQFDVKTPIGVKKIEKK
jgi:hypothetical protein